MKRSNSFIAQRFLPPQKIASRLLALSLPVVLMGVLSTPATAASYYRVKSGDTLQSIANQYDTTVNTLININNLKDKNDIKVGDRIYLTDASAVSYRGKTTTYVVQNGDTLSSIARRFNTKVSTIAELNDMGEDFNKLLVGNTIVVPMPTPITISPVVKKSATDTLTTTVTTTVKTNPATFNYQVKSGETLFGIANKFKVDKNELMTLNGLDYTSKVAIGQNLLIPSSADRLNALAMDKAKTTPAVNTDTAKKVTTTTTTTVAKTTNTPVVDFTNYKVKTGESLSVLAARYNTTVAGLAKINNLSSDAQLKIGQTILVPVPR